MKILEEALIRQFGFFRYIGYAFTEEENGFTLHLRPSHEKEWFTELSTDIHVSTEGFYTEMVFYIDKEDLSESDGFWLLNKFNEGASPVKLHMLDAEDSYAVVGTMPNVCGVDPEFSLDLTMGEEEAMTLADEIQLSVFYLKAYMDTVLADVTGEEEVPDEEEAAMGTSVEGLGADATVAFMEKSE